MEFFYLCNLFVVEKLFKVNLNLIFLKGFSLSANLKIHKYYQRDHCSIDRFKYLARASVTLTSLTKFGGKKMQSGRRERYFSSNYFSPKCNYSKERFLDNTIK